jgi:hypothetical protein
MNQTRRSHRGGNLFGSKKIATMFDPTEKNTRSLMNKVLGVPNFRKLTEKQKKNMIEGALRFADEMGIKAGKKGGRRTRKQRKGRKTRKHH